MDLGRDQRLRSIETLDDFIYIYICTRTCISHARNDRDLLRRRYEEDQGSLPLYAPNPPLVNCFPSKKSICLFLLELVEFE